MTVEIDLPGTILEEYRRINRKWWYLAKSRIYIQLPFLFGWYLHWACSTLLLGILGIRVLNILLIWVFLLLWQHKLRVWYTIIVDIWESSTKKVFLIVWSLVAHTTTCSFLEARTWMRRGILTHFAILLARWFWLLSVVHEVWLVSYSWKRTFIDFSVGIIETNTHLLHHFDIFIYEQFPSRLRSLLIRRSLFNWILTLFCIMMGVSKDLRAIAELLVLHHLSKERIGSSCCRHRCWSVCTLLYQLLK